MHKVRESHCYENITRPTCVTFAIEIMMIKPLNIAVETFTIYFANKVVLLTGNCYALIYFDSYISHLLPFNPTLGTTDPDASQL